MTKVLVDVKSGSLTLNHRVIWSHSIKVHIVMGDNNLTNSPPRREWSWSKLQFSDKIWLKNHSLLPTCNHLNGCHFLASSNDYLQTQYTICIIFWRTNLRLTSSHNQGHYIRGNESIGFLHKPSCSTGSSRCTSSKIGKS